MASFFPDLCTQFSTWPVGFMCPLAFFSRAFPCVFFGRRHMYLWKYILVSSFFLDTFTFNVDHFQRPCWICYSRATVFVILATRDLSPQPGVEPVPLHWNMNSQPQEHQGTSPGLFFYTYHCHIFFFFCPKYILCSLLCQGIMSCMAFLKLLSRILCCGMHFPLPRLSTGRSSDCIWLCSYRQAAGSILDMPCDLHKSSRKNFPVNAVPGKSVICACIFRLSKHLPDSSFVLGLEVVC